MAHATGPFAVSSLLKIHSWLKRPCEPPSVRCFHRQAILEFAHGLLGVLRFQVPSWWSPAAPVEELLQHRTCAVFTP